MTLQEQADALMAEAKEINAQYSILVKDIEWIELHIKALYNYVLCAPFADHTERMKELELLTAKLNINVATRAKIKARSKELGERINKFFGQDIWKAL